MLNLLLANEMDEAARKLLVGVIVTIITIAVVAIICLFAYKRKKYKWLRGFMWSELAFLAIYWIGLLFGLIFSGLVALVYYIDCKIRKLENSQSTTPHPVGFSMPPVEETREVPTNEVENVVAKPQTNSDRAALIVIISLISILVIIITVSIINY